MSQLTVHHYIFTIQSESKKTWHFFKKSGKIFFNTNHEIKLCRYADKWLFYLLQKNNEFLLIHSGDMDGFVNELHFRFEQGKKSSFWWFSPIFWYFYPNLITYFDSWRNFRSKYVYFYWSFINILGVMIQ